MFYRLAIKKYLEEHGFEALSPKAVLFDMDGVLYDSMPNHAIAWQESMARFGIQMSADDAYATEGARGVDTIRPYVDEFIAFAKQHPEMTFLVTKIGCGIAGFRVDEIAPLFADAAEVENIYLPQDFWENLI